MVPGSLLAPPSLKMIWLHLHGDSEQVSRLWAIVPFQRVQTGCAYTKRLFASNHRAAAVSAHIVLLALDLHRPHEVALCCCTGTMAHSTPIQKHTRKTIVTKCFEIIFTARTERCEGDKNQLFCQPCQMFLTTSGTKQCSELCL